MAQLKNPVKQLGGLAAVVRRVVDDAEKAGAPQMNLAQAGLACVEKWLRGEKVSKKDLGAAKRACYKVYQPYWESDGVPRATYFALDAVGRLCASCEDGQDRVDNTLEACGAAHGCIGEKDYSADLRWVRDLYDAALKSPAPKGPAAGLPVAPARAPGKGTESIEAALGTFIHGLMKKAGVERDETLHVAESKIKDLLAKKKYAAHPDVLSFDHTFGGLMVPDPGYDDWFDEGQYSTVGAYACLKSGAHGAPRGGKKQKAAELVPVAYSSNDVIYYLDKYGAGWAHDTISEPDAVRFASNGATLVAKVFLFGLAWGAQTTKADSAEATGARGKAVAKALGLAPIGEASDEHGRWWGSAHNLLFETSREGDITTKIVALDPKGRPAVAKARTLLSRPT